MPYRVKIVETPYMIREYHYLKPVPSNYKQLNKDIDDYEKALTGEKTHYSISRVKEKLALTIQCNVQRWSKFLTFTTKENIKDRAQFLKKWDSFRFKFKHKYGYNIKYSAVTETQKRGSWHLHVIAYNLTHKLDLKELNRLWVKNPKHGNIDVKVVDNPKNLFKYMVKYLTKEELKLNKKAVLNSHGLEQPNVTELPEPPNLQEIYKKPDYQRQWLLYHGDMKKDKINDKNGQLDKAKLNQCHMKEWHK